jgi:hypothetical protein
LNHIENDDNMVKTGGTSELDELIDSLTLFDDDLMTLVFDGNIEATELLLSIILAQEVRVISVRAQVERAVCETGERFGDGSHIIYVNGSYKGDDAIGKLVHDFRCRKADDMYYRQLADGVRYYKESEGGKEKMCEKVERYAEKKAEERARERAREVEMTSKADMVRNLMKNMQLTVNQAFDALGVSEDDRKLIAEKI